MKSDIDKGFDWARKELVNVDTILIFSSGRVCFVYSKGVPPHYIAITWHVKFIGYSTFEEIKKYDINHKVYEASNKHVPEWQKNLLSAEYRKEKIHKLLKSA